jgi:cytochrome oxidase Cu insertion factor (SCO1/SenC/PrrC family)
MKRIVAAAVVLGLATVGGCSSSSSVTSGGASSAKGTTTAYGTAAEMNPNLDLGTSLGGKPAPGFALTNQFGQVMSLSKFRGKIVMLGFEDSECTTVCPLTTESMVLAKELLGPAGTNVQLLGIDANPDATAISNVMAYSKAHGMVNQWDFLTGPLAQLKKTWKAYGIDVEIEQGQIDHTPALYLINSRGVLEKVYLTQMAYDSVGQQAEVLAREISTLLPGHPKLKSAESLAAIPSESPADTATLPAASGSGTVTLGPGKPRLVVFFASWLSETSDLKSELTALSSYPKRPGLPQLVAVDETVTEPSADSARPYLSGLTYPVALDKTGQVADGYGVQDQPWFTLVNAKGKVVWSHDGWTPLSAIEAAAKKAA